MDPRAPAVVGTLVWTVLLGVALGRQVSLVDAGREWWVWTALVGVALGLVAIAWATWLERRRQRREAPSPEPSPELSPGASVPTVDGAASDRSASA